MNKPDSLRAHIEASNPILKRSPETLHVFMERGRIQATGVPGEEGLAAGVFGVGFRYSYELVLLVLEYPGHTDEIFAPILQWMARHQPQVFQNPETQKRAIVYEAEKLANDQVDIEIRLQLDEFVEVVRRPDGGLDVRHRQEPDFTPAEAERLQLLTVNGEDLWANG